jgi:hypothetical protein
MVTQSTATPERRFVNPGRRAGFLIATIAGVLLALALTAARADAHHGRTIVTGTYTVTDFGTTTCAPKGKSADILVCTTTAFKSHYDGNLAGESTTDFTQIVNCKTSRTRGQGVETFGGSLNGGAPGTLTWKITFHSGLDCATLFPSDFHGVGRITAGSGALDRTHGVLRFGDVTYDGVLRLR